MDQAADFLAETQALAGLLAPLPDSAFDEATQFKGWTVGDVIRHLHSPPLTFVSRIFILKC